MLNNGENAAIPASFTTCFPETNGKKGLKFQAFHAIIKYRCIVVRESASRWVEALPRKRSAPERGLPVPVVFPRKTSFEIRMIFFMRT